MNLLKTEHATQSGSDRTTYEPIARALYQLSDTEKDQLRHKFDIAYFTAIEKINLGNTCDFVNLKLVTELTLGTLTVPSAKTVDFPLLHSLVNIYVMQ